MRHDKKKTKKYLKKSLWIVLMLVPFVMALIGYLEYYNGHISYALFNSIKIYAGGFEPSFSELVEPIRTFEGPQRVRLRILLEGARWLAFIVTSTVLIRFFRSVWQKLEIGRKVQHEDVIAIHGSEHYKELLKETLGGNTVTQDVPEKFNAPCHVLAFDSDDALMQYLSEHYIQFARVGAQRIPQSARLQQVYLCLLSAAHTKYSSNGFIVNNIAEDCARLYWKRHYPRRYNGTPEKRIVLIGFDHYGQALLNQALLVNVFVKDRPCMEYHVFGKSGMYRRLHQGIERFASVGATDETRDSLFFYDDGWEEHLPLLERADRVIFCADTDEENIRVFGLLAGQLKRPQLHVRSRDQEMLSALYPDYRMAEGDRDAKNCIFGTDRQLYTREVLLDEQLLKAAKKLHALYLRHRPLDACANCSKKRPQGCVNGCAVFQENWNNLGLFLQRSNIAAADHMEVKLREMLMQDCEAYDENWKLDQGILREYDRAIDACIREDRMEPYQELEHRRWMRLHFMNGWTYADIPKKDADNKKHPLLLPYDELSECERVKDMDAYTVLCELGLK